MPGSPWSNGPPGTGPVADFPPHRNPASSGSGGAPGPVFTQTVEQFANNPFATLTNAITADQTDLTITPVPLSQAPPFEFSSQGTFSIVIDFGLPTVEYIKVGSASGNYFASLTRGAENSVRQPHAAGAQVVQVCTARSLYQLRADAEAIARMGQGIVVSQGATISPARSPVNCFIIDGAQGNNQFVTVNTPSDPIDGDILVLLIQTIVGVTMVSLTAVVGSAGALVDNPNLPGIPIASVTTGPQAGPYAWQYNAAANTWYLLWGLVPVLVRQTFLVSGTFTAPFNGTYTFDGEGGGGAGGAGAPGTTGAQAQNGGGGGGASLPSHGEAFLGAGSTETVTVGAGGTGVAAANGNPGGATSVGNVFLAAGGAGGEYGGTPAAGTGAGGGSNIAANGPARIPPGNPTFFDAGYGGWGGSTGGPLGGTTPATNITQGRGGAGFSHQQVYFGSALPVGGQGGVEGATNTNPGGCGGGGGGAGVGAIGTSIVANGGNGRPGGAGSAAGTGANGANGIAAATNSGAGGGGGGAGGNGALGGGTGGTGGPGGSGHVTVSFVGFLGQHG